MGTETEKNNFFEDNTKYTEIDPADAKAIKGFKDIDENEDEVWLLQCPKGFNVQELEGQKLKFPGRAKIKEFEAVALESATPKTVAFGYALKNKYDVRRLYIAGNILLREKMDPPKNITHENFLESCPPTACVPMPEYIKLRHPLLGANFDEYLKLTNCSMKVPKKLIKKEKSSPKRKNEDSPKKSRTEKRKKLLSVNFDLSEDLKWIKEL